jgi:hypothetical protein
MSHPTPSEAECRALERGLLLGAAREPLALPAAVVGIADETARALAALALLGQIRRFARPGPPARLAEVPRLPAEDSRKLLDPEAERWLRRLVDACSSRATAPLLHGAIIRLAHSGRRPHPFRVARLLAAVKRFSTDQDPATQAWLAGINPIRDPVPATQADGEVIGAENWTRFPRAARVAFLAELRGREPAAGRGLLQACIATEPAAVRADLIGALGTGLSQDDRGLLDQLATDRAQTVREAAAALLARLPGTAGHAEKLARAVAALQIQSGGLIFRRRMLATADKTANLPQLFGALAGLTLADIAARLEVSESELVGMVPPAEQALLLAFAQLAASTGRSDPLAALIAAGRGANWPWTAFALVLTTAATTLPPDTALALLPTLGPFGIDPLPRAPDWRALGRFCGGILPMAQAEPILRSPGWRHLLSPPADQKPAPRPDPAEDVAALAALLPTPVLAALADETGRAGLPIAGAIAALAGLAAALERIPT